jgi:Tfp pilus assembly protein PilO
MSGLEIFIWVVVGILLVSLIVFLIWFFAFRDDGGNVGDECAEESHCKRNLTCGSTGVCMDKSS